METPNPFCSQGLCPLDPKRGAAPVPCWGPRQPPHPSPVGVSLTPSAIYFLFFFFTTQCLFSFAGQPWSDMPCRLWGWKPASQTQARRGVGCELTDCLWLIEEKIQHIFLEKCEGGCVLMLALFSKIQTYRL